MKAPEETRQRLLDAAFTAMQRNGFQAAGLNDILAETGVTKGALYHHFPTKEALGLAVLDERVRAYLEDWWLKPLEGADDPLDAVARSIAHNLERRVPEVVHLGCPLGNLAQEMSPVSEAFRTVIEDMFRQWRRALSRALSRGQHYDKVRVNVDADAAAALIVAGIQGAWLQAKSAQNLDVFQEAVTGLNQFIRQLRP